MQGEVLRHNIFVNRDICQLLMNLEQSKDGTQEMSLHSPFVLKLRKATIYERLEGQSWLRMHRTANMFLSMLSL